MTPFYQLVSVT